MTYVIILIVWNLFTFIIMGVDKQKAKKKKWRISERLLFTCAFLAGGIGILFGMLAFRHKTKHLSFKILVPLAILLDAAVYLYLSDHNNVIFLENFINYWMN